MEATNKLRGRRRGRDRQSGATATEYIIILVLVAVAALAMWKKFGGTVMTKVQETDSYVDTTVQVPAATP